MKIRVATYNIHKGVSSIRSTPRVLALKKAIAQFDADVVFLQEVQGRHDRYHSKFGEESARPPPLAASAPSTSFSPANAHAFRLRHERGVRPRPPRQRAAELLSRSTNSHNHDVSDHAYEQRGILHCVINTEPARCTATWCTWACSKSGRGRQTQALIDCVNDSAPNGEPVIIAGDFNDWRNTLSDKLRNALGVVEVFDELGKRPRIGDLVRSLAGPRESACMPARTFPAALPWFRLDRIYVRGFKVDTAQVLHGTLWAKLSDHAPIVANLSWPEVIATTGSVMRSVNLRSQQRRHAAGNRHRAVPGAAGGHRRARSTKSTSKPISSPTTRPARASRGGADARRPCAACKVRVRDRLVRHRPPRAARDWAIAFAAAGVRYRVFNPWFKRGVARTHRKIAVVDREVAFVGGININDDWFCDYDATRRLPAPRWDFAVQVRGPLVAQIHHETQAQWARVGHLGLMQAHRPVPRNAQARRRADGDKPMQAAFVVRDNLRNRRTIQRAYLQAIGRAKNSVLLANPYFAPGRKFRKALALAARARRRGHAADRRRRNPHAGRGGALVLSASCWRPACSVVRIPQDPAARQGGGGRRRLGDGRLEQLRRPVAVPEPGSQRRGASDAGFAASHARAHPARHRRRRARSACEDFEHVGWLRRAGYEMAYFFYKLAMRVFAIGYA